MFGLDWCGSRFVRPGCPGTESGDGDAFLLGGCEELLVEGCERGSAVFAVARQSPPGRLMGWRCRSRAASTAIASFGW